LLFTHLLGSLVPSVVASIITQQRFYICYCSTFFFTMLSPLIFFVVGHLHPSSFTSSRMFDHVLWTKPNVAFPFPNDIPKDKTIFQTMLNSLMLHQYKLTSTFDLLFDKDFSESKVYNMGAWLLHEHKART